MVLFKGMSSTKLFNKPIRLFFWLVVPLHLSIYVLVSGVPTVLALFSMKAGCICCLQAFANKTHYQL